MSDHETQIAELTARTEAAEERARLAEEALHDRRSLLDALRDQYKSLRQSIDETEKALGYTPGLTNADRVRWLAKELEGARSELKRLRGGIAATRLELWHGEYHEAEERLERMRNGEDMPYGKAPLSIERADVYRERAELRKELADVKQQLASVRGVELHCARAERDNLERRLTCTQEREGKLIAKQAELARKLVASREEVERLNGCPGDMPKALLKAEAERDERKAQCRRGAQILIEEIGATGPENVDETAKRAVAKIRELRDEVNGLWGAVDSFKAEIERYRGAGPVADVVREYHRATAKFGKFNSAHEGFCVLLEEVTELQAEVFKGGSQPRSMANMRTEAVQVGAMALRFLTDVCGIRPAASEDAA